MKYVNDCRKQCKTSEEREKEHSRETTATATATSSSSVGAKYSENVTLIEITYVNPYITGKRTERWGAMHWCTDEIRRMEAHSLAENVYLFINPSQTDVTAMHLTDIISHFIYRTTICTIIWINMIENSATQHIHCCSTLHCKHTHTHILSPCMAPFQHKRKSEKVFESLLAYR